MKKIGAFVLENIFLTKVGTCGMQWLSVRNKRILNTLAIWLDQHDNLCLTSMAPVDVEVVESAIDYYETHSHKYVR